MCFDRRKFLIGSIRKKEEGRQLWNWTFVIGLWRNDCLPSSWLLIRSHFREVLSERPEELPDVRLRRYPIGETRHREGRSDFREQRQWFEERKVQRRNEPETLALKYWKKCAFKLKRASRTKDKDSKTCRLEAILSKQSLPLLLQSNTVASTVAWWSGSWASSFALWLHPMLKMVRLMVHSWSWSCAGMKREVLQLHVLPHTIVSQKGGRSSEDWRMND